MARSKDKHKLLRIYDSALDLVLSDGFTGLKMADVARRSGVATGTLYVYFKDKSELINSLYLHLKKQLAGLYIADFDKDVPFRLAFEKTWFSYAQTALAYSRETIFIEQYYRSPFLNPDIRKKSDELLLPVINLIERGKREWLIKDLPADLLIVQLTGPLHDLLRTTNYSGSKVPDSTLLVLYSLAWDSVKR